MAFTIRHARYWLLAASVAASLGFGASQALAAPAETARAQACRKFECITYCQSRGGEGFCIFDTCVCRIRD